LPILNRGQLEDCSSMTKKLSLRAPSATLFEVFLA